MPLAAARRNEPAVVQCSSQPAKRGNPTCLHIFNDRAHLISPCRGIGTHGIQGLRIALLGAPAYCASKAAVRLLSKAVALEALGGGTGVRVNSLHPAMTETPMVQDIIAQLGGDETTEAQMRALQPSGAIIPVSAVVDAILFLLSGASAYINGTEFIVDNGFTAQ